jgi:L-seryl-tRNA(Ser) seleniumtransferase
VNDRRRELPAIDRLLGLPEVQRLMQAAPRSLVVAAAREAVAAAREGRGGPPGDWAAEIAERVAARAAASLVPVLNATGVVLHTNLGRAPLAEAALAAVRAVGADYSNLELDLTTGSRGSRLDHCATLLAEVAGAEDAIAVNNAAGALVLALDATARGREVIISRGELIEIGGSFRIPDILEKSGATLREVGTTNRTHLADYQRALGDRTGAVLVVHRSNFAMTGFVSSPPPAELAALARARGVPCLFDVGSGLLVDLSAFGLSGEPLVAEAARIADLVIFSGDKLLGGPQAGCAVGRRALIGALRASPLARALRTDKLTLAALEATLALYRDREQALAEIPVLRMVTLAPEELRDRAERLAALVPAALEPTLVPGRSAVGGGSFPAAELPTTLVALHARPFGAQALALKLRLGTPSVVARVEGDRVVLDPRTLPADRFAEVAAALSEAARGDTAPDSA